MAWQAGLPSQPFLPACKSSRSSVPRKPSWLVYLLASHPGCSSYMLALTLGRQKAAGLILAGLRASADDLSSTGLVTQVLQTQGFLDRVLGIARDCAKLPSKSLEINKQLLTGSMKCAMLQANDHECALLKQMSRDEKCQSAFTEFKRKQQRQNPASCELLYPWSCEKTPTCDLVMVDGCIQDSTESTVYHKRINQPNLIHVLRWINQISPTFHFVKFRSMSANVLWEQGQQESCCTLGHLLAGSPRFVTIHSRLGIPFAPVAVTCMQSAFNSAR